MLKTRVIPVLLLRDSALVKTVKFKKFSYIGDPCNTIRIFNELEVDELVLLDILASRRRSKPDYKLISEVANECFMPLSYGGGIRSIHDIKKILNIGLEKVVINSYAVECPHFITEAADKFGSQCIIGSMDVKKDFWGNYRVYTYGGMKKTKLNPISWSTELEKLGAGELLITSIDREGTWEGYDIDLLKSITSKVNIPVISHGGAGNLNHLSEAINRGSVSAVALGSMVVFQKIGMGVLINFPSKSEIEEASK